jgi:hypothetical protein
MPTELHPDSSRAWPSRLGLLASALVGSAVALAVGLALPNAAFRARVLIVSIDPVPAPLETLVDGSVPESIMRRAVGSLVDAGVAIPPPDLAEKIALTLGLGGARATGRADRLAAYLAHAVTIMPGAAPSTTEIAAVTPDAVSAAHIAKAVADAALADRDAEQANARARRDFAARARVEVLRREAADAHRRLAELGIPVDQAQLLVSAGYQTKDAQARVDAIHAMIASGSPPLSDRRDMPIATERLQSTYLDLQRQLAKARETLGDRHTTIIALQGEVRHAAAALTAEWQSLARAAEADLRAAQAREATLRARTTGMDAGGLAALDTARRDARIVDDLLSHAETALADPLAGLREDRFDRPFAAGTVAVGLSAMLRMMIAALIGVLVAGLGVRRATMRAALEGLVGGRATPRDERRSPSFAWLAPSAVQLGAAAVASVGAGGATIRDDDPEVAGAPAAQPVPTTSDTASDDGRAAPNVAVVPTIMVAANEEVHRTMPIALAIGRAAAAEGHRVLVLETTGSSGRLASASHADADPLLVDVFGVLRVMLRAEATEGLYLAPNLDGGAQIASALARQGEALVVDDIVGAFDLIVIDGGLAETAAADGWRADAYVRVGRSPSRFEDHRFAATLGIPASLLVEAILPESLSLRGSERPDMGVPEVKTRALRAVPTSSDFKQSSLASGAAFSRRRLRVHRAAGAR